jgi:signal transduction histidine kinase
VPVAPDDPSDRAARAGHRELVESVVADYVRRLVAENNALVRDADRTREVVRQAELVLGDVVLGSGPPTVPVAGEARLLSVEVGTNRARGGVHPTESLRAAALLFEVALPVLIVRCTDGTPAQTLDLSRRLHTAVMDRVTVAALSYVDFLKDRLQASRQDERRRIARELHDRIGHGMGLARQNLDLFQHYTEHDPARAPAKMANALGSLAEAMRTVQQLSAELRRSVGDAGLEPALRSYLRANVPPEVTWSLEVAGDTKTLPANVGEELYLILREATRNALRHADAGRIQVGVDIGESSVTAFVTDDGRGFEPAGTPAAPGGGLPSMTERAELLQADLDLTSTPGRGTTVRLVVPLERQAP